MIHESLYAPVGRIASADIDGELVVMSETTGRYYGLNGTASVVWRYIAAEGDVSAAIAWLAECYGVDAETVERDVAELCNELMQCGLIRRRSAPRETR
jgi:hypothetical protein